MKAVIQRVTHASVDIEGKTVANIGNGFLILLGVCEGDTEKECKVLSDKIAKMRIFCDENDKMNLSLLDVSGDAIVVSQFTLMANYKKGNRPDYLQAAAPAEANRLYEYFIEVFEKELGKKVGRGVFGAHMDYEIHNDGPVTILMDSDVLKKK